MSLHSLREVLLSQQGQEPGPSLCLGERRLISLSRGTARPGLGHLSRDSGQLGPSLWKKQSWEGPVDAFPEGSKGPEAQGSASTNWPHTARAARLNTQHRTPPHVARSGGGRHQTAQGLPVLSRPRASHAKGRSSHWPPVACPVGPAQQHGLQLRVSGVALLSFPAWGLTQRRGGWVA